MTIDELSKKSGVSGSMLSQVEQEKTNPTVMTVWKIARSLDVDINKLLKASERPRMEIMRSEDMPVIYSADGKCKIRINSPVHMIDNLELYQIILEPGGCIASEPHFPKTQEFLTVLSGELKITLGGNYKILYEGDTLRYNADIEHVIENVSTGESRAYLVVWFPS